VIGSGVMPACVDMHDCAVVPEVMWVEPITCSKNRRCCCSSQILIVMSTSTVSDMQQCMCAELMFRHLDQSHSDHEGTSLCTLQYACPAFLFTLA
jgi:hypothetical protein